MVGSKLSTDKLKINSINVLKAAWYSLTVWC